MTANSQTREVDCDLLVIGSGAAGLSAAVTAAWHGLKVTVVEKDPVFGGATAWSGGWMWVPLNPLATRAGIIEDPEQPRTYLRHELGDRYDATKVMHCLRPDRIWSRSSSGTPPSSSWMATGFRMSTATCPAPALGVTK
jgi:succinate dehydrogenase/fumarate reductase flavoprotein subunit